MEDKELVANLEMAVDGLWNATSNMAGPQIRRSVEAMLSAVQDILPRFKELAFGEVRKVPDDATEVEPVFKKGEKDEQPVAIRTERESLHMLSEAALEMVIMMRKDMEDRARGPITRR